MQFLLVFLEHEDLSIVTLNLDVLIFYVLKCGLRALNFYFYFLFLLNNSLCRDSKSTQSNLGVIRRPHLATIRLL
jgi:hypothetical protein